MLLKFYNDDESIRNVLKGIKFNKAYFALNKVLKEKNDYKAINSYVYPSTFWNLDAPLFNFTHKPFSFCNDELIKKRYDNADLFVFLMKDV